MNAKVEVIYQQQQWSDYSAAFASVQTIFQRQLQCSAIEHLAGKVGDFGCGSAKIAPLLEDNSMVSGYTGIDCSVEMIEYANSLLATLQRPSFTTWLGKIEDYNDCQFGQFDSAVSLNSFYSWPEPVKVLAHIATLLKPGGQFVLATPNKQIATQMPLMLKEAEKELIFHPHWPAFKQQNLAFVANSDAHFIEMDSLINMAHQAGFVVRSCHQSFYLGALNFLVLGNSS